MEIVKGKAVQPPPDLPFEDVEVPVLGGVRVRGLTLSQRMAFRARAGKQAADDAQAFAAIPELLAMSVVDAQGNPVYSAARWDTYGATHEAAALDLFNAAMRVSGLSGGDAKKN